ncbi:CPBP family intramembrane metalloprotease [Coriobacteriales bacterium OH1046]|nr:CPBP family intramembrane metalloprotease [Coriobacteriales bacterium OH1046]
MDSRKRALIVVRLLFATAVWFALQRAYSVFADPFLEGAVPRLPRMVLASMIVPYTIGLGVFYLIVRSMEARTPSEGAMGVSPAAIGRYFVIQSGLSFPVIVITNIATMMLGGQITGLSSGEILGNLPFYTILLLVFNPLLEELLFRKLILGRLMVLGARPAIICSALLFALPHAFSLGLAQMLYTFVLGLVWGHVTVESGSLLPAIVLHALSNVYGTFIPMIPRTLPAANLAFMAVYMLIMPIAAIALAVREHKRAVAQKSAA